MAEHATLLSAARIRLRDARAARDEAPWYRSWAAGHAVRAAEDEVARLEASAPPPAPPTSPLAQRLLSELDHRQNRDVGGAR